MRDQRDGLAEARISIRADGTIKFDRKAVAAFAGRGIEFASFLDERIKRITGRRLTLKERRVLKENVRSDSQPADIDNFGDFLREIGIKIRKDRRYEARWSNCAGDHLIVRIK